VLNEIVRTTIASVALRYRSAAQGGRLDWDNAAAVDARAQTLVRQGVTYSDALTHLREQEALSEPISGDAVIPESAELDRKVCAYMRERGMRDDQYVEALHAVVAGDQDAPS
jgi:hypothetical protein